MFIVTDEVVFNFLMLSLSAKGLPAIWVLPAVTLLLLALAWRIAAGRR